MTWEEIEQQIMYRMWRCNELTKKQAEDYAWIAVNEMQKCLPLLGMNAEADAVNAYLHKKNAEGL